MHRISEPLSTDFEFPFGYRTQINCDARSALLCVGWAVPVVVVVVARNCSSGVGRS